MQAFHTLLKLGRRLMMEKTWDVTGVIFSGVRSLFGINATRKRIVPCQRRHSK
jgi:hypothetical protein